MAKDWLGSRIANKNGELTKRRRFNLALALAYDKPRTIRQLAEAAKVKIGRFDLHLRDLCDSGKVKKQPGAKAKKDDEYVLTSPPPPADLDEANRVIGPSAIDAGDPAQALPLHTDGPPLRIDEGGVIRVGRSRISLDLVVEQYENGMTTEDIVRAYDTLELSDVRGVIAYYLRRRDEVQAYLKQRKEEAEALRARIEAERPHMSREELLARRMAKENADAPTGQ